MRMNWSIAVAALLTSHLAAASPSLGKAKIVRGEKYIVNFELSSVAGTPDATGVGGITDPNSLRVEGCEDRPNGAEKGWQGKTIDVGSNLQLLVAEVVDAGKSGRGWAGTQCGFALTDTQDATKGVDIPRDGIPKFNAPSAVLRDKDRAYVPINFNGYAKETSKQGNFVVALDLAQHKELWRSAHLSSNAQIIQFGGVIVTGYGFTSEKASLIVLDAATGKQLQKVALPKMPSTIIKSGDKLYVQLYDGYAVFPIKGL